MSHTILDLVGLVEFFPSSNQRKNITAKTNAIHPAWFPFLFYTSTWVGETYFEYNASQDEKKSTDRSGDVGRIGSKALLIFSLVTLFAAVVFPWCITPQHEEENQRQKRRAHSQRPASFATASPLDEPRRYRKPDLKLAYLVSHLIFACAMSMAPLVKSVGFATTLVAISGM